MLCLGLRDWFTGVGQGAGKREEPGGDLGPQAGGSRRAGEVLSQDSLKPFVPRLPASISRQQNR